MRQNVIKYLILLVLLICIHVFFNGWGLIVASLMAGVLSYPWFRDHRLFLLYVFLLELLIGLGYWMLVWNKDLQLQYLTMNSTFSALSWVGITVGINSITVFLCLSTPFCLLQVLRTKPYPSYRHKVVADFE
jgi:hypothetical protein